MTSETFKTGVKPHTCKVVMFVAAGFELPEFGGSTSTPQLLSWPQFISVNCTLWAVRMGGNPASCLCLKWSSSSSHLAHKKCKKTFKWSGSILDLCLQFSPRNPNYKTTLPEIGPHCLPPASSSSFHTSTCSISIFFYFTCADSLKTTGMVCSVTDVTPSQQYCEPTLATTKVSTVGM